MTTTTKTKPKTQNQLALDALRTERDVLYLALSSLASSHVKWFRSGCYSVGICRETSACGGIVLVKFQGAFCAAHYYEQWKPIVFRNAETLQSPESMALRVCAESIGQHMRTVQGYATQAAV